MSFLSRIYTEMGNALSDAYGHIMHGDDAGKSASLALIVRPQPNFDDSSTISKFELGMTFIQVNDRAYVRTVSPDSDAARAGIQPRDCVQFAVVLGGNKLSEYQDDEPRAMAYAFECEKLGRRTSYEELRSLFYNCTAPPKPYHDENSIPNLDPVHDASEDEISLKQSRFPLETFHSDPSSQSLRTNLSKTVRSTTQTVVGRCSPSHLSSSPTILPYTPDKGAIYPVVLVFRRTRKRQFGSTSHAPLPSFRLDDECERAASLIRRLAPTIDTEPQPDAWDEIVHDATEYLLPDGSILPFEGVPGGMEVNLNGDVTAARNSPLRNRSEDMNGIGLEQKRTPSRILVVDDIIPLDKMEVKSSNKLSRVRSRMHAEAMKRSTAENSNAAFIASLDEDVEASTIRGMIQQAMGLAFVRSSKVVLGVSVHGGSGIVIARLSDGTWSAPSAIGTYGVGLGIQFGLEVADYIFILQTKDALEHFRCGGNFTIGGNVGAAVAGLGREAYGAASLKGAICSNLPDKEDQYGDNGVDKNHHVPIADLAPIVAYAKSQGLYFGVSLEGSKIYTRDDINSRTYKFTTGKEVTAYDILTGKVPTPPEAEDLYASLHSVEFTHEIWSLPRPPDLLCDDLQNEWRFDRSTLTAVTRDREGEAPAPFSFLTNLSDKDAQEFSEFETKFKKFLYGGVSVQRLVPDGGADGEKTRRERRTLWLMLPEVGALRLGFISKLSDGSEGDLKSMVGGSDRGRIQNDGHDDYSEYSELPKPSDHSTQASEKEVYWDETDSTVDTTKYDSTLGNKRSARLGRVHLSNKHSIALTDITRLSQNSDEPLRYSPEDQTECLRVISIKDVSGVTLLFLANNFREAELLVCGLKLLLERETARLGVRGGVPITQLGGLPVRGGMSPKTARGQVSDKRLHRYRNSSYPSADTRQNGMIGRRVREIGSPLFENAGYVSSENEEEGETIYRTKDDESVKLHSRHAVPEGRKSWSQVPARNYLRSEASGSKSLDSDKDDDYNENTFSSERQTEGQKYVHGQLLNRDVATNVHLPLPLPLCRVLLLDSSSPVIRKWEVDRGDTNYSKTKWTFPPSTPRELELHSSEHQLIASGSMMGGYRIINFDRLRNGQKVNLSETQIIDADDTEKLAFTVSERMPRRGFSIKIRILLRAISTHSCEATIIGELRPMGKNMSNQAAVHKAFLLVVDELKARYGKDKRGLLAGFLKVINDLPSPENAMKSKKSSHKQVNIKSKNNLRAIKTRNRSPERITQQQEVTHHRIRDASSKKDGLISFGEVLNSQSTPEKPEDKKQPVLSTPERPTNKNSIPERPPTPSTLDRMSHERDRAPRPTLPSNEFAEMPTSENGVSSPTTIEVKPLPKIRLALMPAPREEDEENESTSSPTIRKKHGKSRSKRKTSRRWKR